MPEEPVGRTSNTTRRAPATADSETGGAGGGCPGSQTLTSAAITVRMACATVLPVDWKALKSCVPTKRAGRLAHRADVERPGTARA